MFAYLTMNIGQRAGANFPLDASAETLIGRGSECSIVLTDPLCSRVHARMKCEQGRWVVRDADSRNGLFVNDQRVAEAVLDRGHRFRVGSTEFAFHQSNQPPTVGQINEISLTQTVVRDTAVGAVDTTSLALAAIQGSEQAHDLLLLHQLSIKLLGCTDPQALLRVALDLLRARTQASVVGFLWISDDGHLKPKLVVPEQAAQRVALSEELTRLVTEQGHAIWVANQRSAGGDETLEHYADALCVPLVHESRVLGAVHVYLDDGRFRQSQFDFAISLANITAVALARSRREEILESQLRRFKDITPGHDELVGESPSMRDLKSKIERLARASGCALIRGESGTGKELVARALHRASPRADRPMVAVNCAAIPADLMESQLFGHKAGSFTSADRDHVGYFQQADQGTLFLDEVGEMPLAGQSKLLRILEGHAFLPVGGTTPISVDVRVIAATNRDLLSYVKEKKFREDLYYRLNVFELVVPALRDRGSDIELLIDFFLDHFRRLHSRPTITLSETARRKMLSYNWPGNVRQLRNVIDSAVVLAAGDQIQVEDLSLGDAVHGEFDSLRIDDWERRLIAEALKRTSDNVPEAARLLGIGRATLYRKIEEYGIRR